MDDCKLKGRNRRGRKIGFSEPVNQQDQSEVAA